MCLHRADDLSDLGAEHLGERPREVVAVLHRPALEVREGRELHGPGADARLDRPLGVALCPPIEQLHADRAALDLARHRHTAGLVEGPDVTALGLRARRVRQFLVAEALRALEPVPEERPDAHVVVVEPHLAVGQDVEAGILLILDHDARRIVERLGMRRELERLEDVLAGELMREPGRARIRADHRRREQGGHGPAILRLGLQAPLHLVDSVTGRSRWSRCGSPRHRGRTTPRSPRRHSR